MIKKLLTFLHRARGAAREVASHGDTWHKLKPWLAYVLGTT